MLKMCGALIFWLLILSPPAVAQVVEAPQSWLSTLVATVRATFAGQPQAAEVTPTVEVAPSLMGNVEAMFRNSGCFPENVAKSLGDAGKSVPVELKNILSPDRNKKVVVWDSRAALFILHSATFKNTKTSSPVAIVADTAESYSNFDILGSMDGGTSNYYYAIDCTGYLSTSLAADATFAANAKVSAESILRANRSLLYVRARVRSPTALALDTILDANSTQRNNLSVMYALAAAAIRGGAIDDAEISAPLYINMAWTSSSLMSSFTAKSNLDAGGSMSAGVFSFSAAGQAKASMGRSVAFNSFDTYVFDGNEFSASTTLGKLKARVVNSMNRLRPSSAYKANSNTTIVFYEMAPSICNAGWDVYDQRGDNRKLIGSAVPNSNGPCKLTVTFDADQADDVKKNFYLIASNTIGEFVMAVKIE